MQQNEKVLSISAVNLLIREKISMTDVFSDLTVKGEVSSIIRNESSHHVYFTLKDRESSISCVMYRWAAERYNKLPEKGDSVVIRCKVDFYMPNGKLSLIANSFGKDGEGEQLIALRKLKEKLQSEGLFDRKRPIPENPSVVCVITSSTGAAVHDVEETVRMRNPLVKIVEIHASVQGAGAASSVISAIRKANEIGADVLIFGRGGGSEEDLSAFNDEALARAVFESAVPTISAVGHQINQPVCDLVADLSVVTPTAAAQAAVPDLRIIRQSINELGEAIRERTEKRIEKCRLELRVIDSLIKSQSPSARISDNRHKLNAVKVSIRNSYEAMLKKYETELAALGRTSVRNSYSSIIERKTESLIRTAQAIELVNPLAVLMRGYSIAYKDGKAVRSASEVAAGDKVLIKLGEGEFTAEVK